jgi:hypothetical protein
VYDIIIYLLIFSLNFYTDIKSSHSWDLLGYPLNVVCSISSMHHSFSLILVTTSSMASLFDVKEKNLKHDIKFPYIYASYMMELNQWEIKKVYQSQVYNSFIIFFLIHFSLPKVDLHYKYFRSF